MQYTPIILDEELESFRAAVDQINAGIKNKSIVVVPPDDSYELHNYHTDLMMAHTYGYDDANLVNWNSIPRQEISNISESPENEIFLELMIPTRDIAFRLAIVFGSLLIEKNVKPLRKHLILDLLGGKDISDDAENKKGMICKLIALPEEYSTFTDAVERINDEIKTCPILNAIIEYPPTIEYTSSSVNISNISAISIWAESVDIEIPTPNIAFRLAIVYGSILIEKYRDRLPNNLILQLLNPQPFIEEAHKF